MAQLHAASPTASSPAFRTKREIMQYQRIPPCRRKPTKTWTRRSARASRRSSPTLRCAEWPPSLTVRSAWTSSNDPHFRLSLGGTTRSWRRCATAFAQRPKEARLKQSAAVNHSHFGGIRPQSLPILKAGFRGQDRPHRCACSDRSQSRYESRVQAKGETPNSQPCSQSPNSTKATKPMPAAIRSLRGCTTAGAGSPRGMTAIRSTIA